MRRAILTVQTRAQSRHKRTCNLAAAVLDNYFRTTRWRFRLHDGFQFYPDSQNGHHGQP